MTLFRVLHTGRMVRTTVKLITSAVPRAIHNPLCKICQTCLHTDSKSNECVSTLTYPNNFPQVKKPVVGFVKVVGVTQCIKQHQQPDCLKRFPLVNSSGSNKHSQKFSLTRRTYRKTNFFAEWQKFFKFSLSSSNVSLVRCEGKTSPCKNKSNANEFLCLIMTTDMRSVKERRKNKRDRRETVYIISEIRFRETVKVVFTQRSHRRRFIERGSSSFTCEYFFYDLNKLFLCSVTDYFSWMQKQFVFGIESDGRRRQKSGEYRDGEGIERNARLRS